MGASLHQPAAVKQSLEENEKQRQQIQLLKTENLNLQFQLEKSKSASAAQRVETMDEMTSPLHKKPHKPAKKNSGAAASKRDI